MRVRFYCILTCTFACISKISYQTTALSQRCEVPYIHRSFIHDSCQAGLNSTRADGTCIHPLDRASLGLTASARALFETHDGQSADLHLSASLFVSDSRRTCDERCDMIPYCSCANMCRVSSARGLAVLVKQAQTWMLDGMVMYMSSSPVLRDRLAVLRLSCALSRIPVGGVGSSLLMTLPNNRCVGARPCSQH